MKAVSSFLIANLIISLCLGPAGAGARAETSSVRETTQTYLRSLRALEGDLSARKAVRRARELTESFFGQLVQGSAQEQAAKSAEFRAALREDLETRFPGRADAVLARLDSDETQKSFRAFAEAVERGDRKAAQSETRHLLGTLGGLASSKSGQAIHACTIGLWTVGGALLATGLFMNLKASHYYPEGKGGLNTSGVVLTIVGAIISVAGFVTYEDGC